MTRGTGSPIDPDALLHDFRLYDRSVDIVSAYHWYFTATREMPEVVAHFERYPKLAHPVDGRDVTPDFTVLFNDGRAVVAEIANISLHDESLEKLCRQLGRYDSMDAVPGPNGTVVAAKVVDVMFLTPYDTGVDAARRLFDERLDRADHPYSPRRRPVLVQVAATTERYSFQVWQNSNVNGQFALGTGIDLNGRQQLNIRPDRFAENKARYGLMNDPVDPLYLATRLWTQVFPSEFWVAGDKNEFTADAGAIAHVVVEMFGRGRTGDVKVAMGLLVAAGLASADGKSWRVPRRSIRTDIAEYIADRIGATSGERGHARQRGNRRAPTQGQGSLFDL